MKKFQIKYALFLGAVVFLFSCSAGQNKTGKIYMPDMTYSQAFETYSPNPNYDDGQTARQPVQGTIPRGALSNSPSAEELGAHESYEYKTYYADDPDSYEAAGKELKNPLPLNDETLAKGGKVYSIYCMVCHGAKGDGKGSIVVYEDGSAGPFPPVPDYKDRLKGLPEGKMFHSITYGKNLMGSYASQVSPEERWQVIYYIQKLSGTGRFAETQNTASSDQTN